MSQSTLQDTEKIDCWQVVKSRYGVCFASTDKNTQSDFKIHTGSSPEVWYVSSDSHFVTLKMRR